LPSIQRSSAPTLAPMEMASTDVHTIHPSLAALQSRLRMRARVPAGCCRHHRPQSDGSGRYAISVPGSLAEMQRRCNCARRGSVRVGWPSVVAVEGRRPELLLDLQQTIVFGDALGTAQ